MTTVFFLRHGLTVENKDGRIQGQLPGTLLIPESERYLAAVTPLLREQNLQVLISSDLARAVETRKILHRFLGLSTIRQETNALLREISAGFFEGMLWEDMPLAARADRAQGIYNFRPAGGENEADVQARVTAALQYFASHYVNQRICCITHAVWLKQLVSLADQATVADDHWWDRSSIYRGRLGAGGVLTDFSPLPILAQVKNEHVVAAQ